MPISCPICHNQMTESGPDVYCPHCDKKMTRQACCPDCHKPLQVLKACGAVDYFCQNGHGLISKKRVEFIVTE